MSVAEIKQLFDRPYSEIDTRAKTSPTEKDALKAELEGIQSAVPKAAKKNDKIDDSIFSRRFCHIARMAPDVFNVVVATLENSLVGLGVAVNKIAYKAKEEGK